MLMQEKKDMLRLAGATLVEVYFMCNGVIEFFCNFSSNGPVMSLGSFLPLDAFIDFMILICSVWVVLKSAKNAM
jgi:hypothetical protein